MLGSAGLMTGLSGDTGEFRYSRGQRLSDWENDQYQRLADRKQEIEDEESHLLKNPDITAMILQLLGLQDGAAGQGGNGWQPNR